jgi:hypothetical protein
MCYLRKEIIFSDPLNPMNKGIVNEDLLNMESIEQFINYQISIGRSEISFEQTWIED